MERAEREVEKALAKLPDDQKLMVLSKVKARLGVEMKIHISKLTGVALGEWIVCQEICDHLGGRLVWNKSTPNGVDATNSQGRGVEIKCTDRSAKAAAANYRNPTRWKDESDAAYQNRVRAHWLDNYSGGHYWVSMSQSYTKIESVTFIPGLQFATAMSKRALTHTKNAHNFGGAWCKTCGYVHRFMKIAEELTAGRGFPTAPVKSQCK